MTLTKLIRVLNYLVKDANIKMRGSHIGCTSGGELELVFSSQPERDTHKFLLNLGFILWNGSYIYRPRMKS
jgi:hypothetical protein